MYLAPLWSGILICNWQSLRYSKIEFTRLLNNVVENYFNHTKNDLKLLDLFPSEITSTLYERLQMKYYLYYNIEENKSQEPKKMFEKLERWQRVTKCKREKGFYYKNFNLNFEEDDFHIQMKTEPIGEKLNVIELFELKGNFEIFNRIKLRLNSHYINYFHVHLLKLLFLYFMIKLLNRDNEFINF
jgi:hypothetical protein